MIVENNETENKLILHSAEGSMTPYERIKLIFHGMTQSQVKVNGEEKNLIQMSHSYFLPLEKFDPFFDPDTMGEEQVKTTLINYTSEKIEVSW